MIGIRKDRCLLLNIASIAKLAERVLLPYSVCNIGFGRAFAVPMNPHS